MTDPVAEAFESLRKHTDLSTANRVEKLIRAILAEQSAEQAGTREGREQPWKRPGVFVGHAIAWCEKCAGVTAASDSAGAIHYVSCSCKTLDAGSGGSAGTVSTVSPAQPSEPVHPRKLSPAEQVRKVEEMRGEVDPAGRGEPSDEERSRRVYDMIQRIRDVGRPGGTLVEFPFEELHKAVAAAMAEEYEAGKAAQKRDDRWHCPKCGASDLDEFFPKPKAPGGTPCESCNGSGQVYAKMFGGMRPCRKCKGTGQSPEGAEVRSKRFNDTTGALTWGMKSAAKHPDRCECQGNETTPHKHYDEPPFDCARCKCEAYRPHDAEPPHAAPATDEGNQ